MAGILFTLEIVDGSEVKYRGIVQNTSQSTIGELIADGSVALQAVSDAERVFAGWLASGYTDNVGTDVLVQGDCTVASLVNLYESARGDGYTAENTGIRLTAKYKTTSGSTGGDSGSTGGDSGSTGGSSSGGGGSVSAETRKFVDDKAAAELAAKTKELVGKKQDAMLHAAVTVTPDDWKANGNGYCTKYVAADEMGFSGNVALHVSPIANGSSQYSLIASGFKVMSFGWDAANGRYMLTLQSFGTGMSTAVELELTGYAADKCTVSCDLLALPTNRMGSVSQNMPYPLLHTDAYDALQKKLDVAGGTMTGDLAVPNLATDGVVLAHNLRGQGGASDYWHAIDIGYSGHDGMGFYEYNGTYDFYQSTEAGTQHTATKVGSITPDGWVGDAKLAGAPTAPTPDAGDSSTRVATTEFVGTALSSISSLPAASASDSGKFLTVNSSGNAEWTSVPSAEGVSF